MRYRPDILQEHGESEEIADWFVTVHYVDALFQTHHTARFELPNCKRREALSGARLQWLELYGLDLDKNENVGLWIYSHTEAEKGGEA